MKASNVIALHRTMPLWLVPCVCLPLLLLYPSKAEPTPHTTAVKASVVRAAPPAISAPELPAAAAPEPETVRVVLTRGPKRLELELPRDGKVSRETAKEIARLMRCRVSGRMRRIAPGTLALVADIAARFPGHEIEVVSAVRDEPDRTRAGVKHSKHWTGHAIDLKVQGVKLSEVRDAIWKHHRNIGVGWYPQSGFIHVDYRPRDGDTAWTQPRRNADNHYNPRWARLARAADAEHGHDHGDAEPAAWRANVKAFLDTGATLVTLVPFIGDALGVSEPRSVRDPRNS